MPRVPRPPPPAEMSSGPVVESWYYPRVFESTPKRARWRKQRLPVTLPVTGQLSKEWSLGKIQILHPECQGRRNQSYGANGRVANGVVETKTGASKNSSAEIFSYAKPTGFSLLTSLPSSVRWVGCKIPSTLLARIPGIWRRFPSACWPTS